MATGSIARRWLTWTVAVAAMMLALLAPALWNGFPIVFYDTGGYIERVFDRNLAIGRSAFYGAFLVLGLKLSFWPSIIAQAALTIWLVALTLRAYGLRTQPGMIAAIVVSLCVVTGLPWYAAQLLPDILVPATVLALALLTLRLDALARWQRVALAAVIAAGIAGHMSIAALAIGLLIAAAILRPLARRFAWPTVALAWPTAAVAAGLMLAPLSNLVLTGQFAFTPGGFNFVFGRLLQDGVVERYLAEHCPDPSLSLCAFRGTLPDDADNWLWDPESALYTLGGFAAFEPQARRIVLESLAAYPWMNLRTAVFATIQQFASVTTGDGITPWSWHTQWTLERFAPDALAQYLASRQAQAPIDFGPMNLMHLPVQALAISVLPAVAILMARRRVAALAAFVFVALWINAAIGGVLANPHDRYQSRLAWLGPFVVIVAVLNHRRGHPTPPG